MCRVPTLPVPRNRVLSHTLTTLTLTLTLTLRVLTLTLCALTLTLRVLTLTLTLTLTRTSHPTPTPGRPAFRPTRYTSGRRPFWGRSLPRGRGCSTRPCRGTEPTGCYRGSCAPCNTTNPNRERMGARSPWRTRRRKSGERNEGVDVTKKEYDRIL